MIRSLLWHAFLVVLPFLLYWGYVLFAKRMRMRSGGTWNETPFVGLLAAGVALMLASLFLLPGDGAPPGSVYIPAHEENGRLVPGRLIPAPEASDQDPVDSE